MTQTRCWSWTDVLGIRGICVEHITKSNKNNAESTKLRINPHSIIICYIEMLLLSHLYWIDRRMYINCNALQPIRCVHWTRFTVHFMGCHHFLQEISFGTSVNLEFNHKFISIVVLCPVNRSRCALCIVVHCAMNIAFSGCFRWMYQIPYLSSTGNWILHHWFGTKFYYKVRFLSFAQSFRFE